MCGAFEKDIEPKINILKKYATEDLIIFLPVIESMMKDVYKRGYDQCNKDNNYSSVNQQF